MQTEGLRRRRGAVEELTNIDNGGYEVGPHGVEREEEVVTKVDIIKTGKGSRKGDQISLENTRLWHKKEKISDHIYCSIMSFKNVDTTEILKK